MAYRIWDGTDAVRISVAAVRRETGCVKAVNDVALVDSFPSMPANFVGARDFFA